MGARVYIRNAEGKDKASVKDDKVLDCTPWKDEIRTEAVNIYVKTGNLKEVERRTGVPYPTLQVWKTTKWWDECFRSLKGEKNLKLSHRVELMLEKAFDQLEDRLQKGDSQYNPQTGELMKVPVKAQVINAITANLHKQRIELTNQPTEHEMHDKDATAAKLQELATAFTAFVKGKTKEEVRANNEFEVLNDGTVIDGNGQVVNPNRYTPTTENK